MELENVCARPLVLAEVIWLENCACLCATGEDNNLVQGSDPVLHKHNFIA